MTTSRAATSPGVVFRMAGLLAMGVLMIGAFAQTGLLMTDASAQSGVPISAAPQSAPVNQCNDDAASNVGGQGIRCTVTVANFLTSTGAIDPSKPSTVTVTRCVGAAGPIGAGAGTCTTTTSTSTTPVTSVTQCNGSANGGGGVLSCTVTMTNTFAGSAAAPTSATVYQCVGSVITGTGAPGTCTPANTPGVTSVTAATVGQCNGSGNGGTSVGFVCTVSGSTSSTLSVNVDQCNGSANGGGSKVNCSASVTAVVAGAAATPAPATTAPVAAAPAPVVATPAPVAAIPATAAPIAKLPSTSTQDPGGVPSWAFILPLAAFGLIVLRVRARERRVTTPKV